MIRVLKATAGRCLILFVAVSALSIRPAVAQEVELFIAEAPCVDQMPVEFVPEGSTCSTFRVTCSGFPNVPSILVEVRRTQPVGGSTAGTIVMTTGGGRNVLVR